MKKLSLMVIFINCCLIIATTHAEPHTITVDVSAFGGSAFELGFYLFDNNFIVGDSYVLIDNISVRNASGVLMSPGLINFESGELEGFDVSLNPSAVSLVLGGFRDAGVILRLDEDPLVTPTITFRDFLPPSAAVLRFDFEFIGSRADRFVASLLSPDTRSPLGTGLTDAGDFLDVTAERVDSAAGTTLERISAEKPVLIDVTGKVRLSTQKVSYGGDVPQIRYHISLINRGLALAKPIWLVLAERPPDSRVINPDALLLDSGGNKEQPAFKMDDYVPGDQLLPGHSTNPRRIDLVNPNQGFSPIPLRFRIFAQLKRPSSMLPTEAQGGSPLIIAVDEPGIVRYRLGGKVEWKAISLERVAHEQINAAPSLAQSETAHHWEATIPPKDVTFRGLVYGITPEGQSEPSPENLIPVTVTADFKAAGTTTLPLMGASFGAFQWYGVSLPGTVTDSSPAGVFDANAGWGRQNIDWVAWVYDPALGWSDSFVLSPGRGTFLMSLTERGMTLQTISNDITRPFSIPLLPGWNLVGNPFGFERFWDDQTITVKTADGAFSITDAAKRDLVHHTIWWYNPNGPSDDMGGVLFDTASSEPSVPNQAVPFPASIGPMSAFWVLAFVESDLEISPTADRTTPTPQQASLQLPNPQLPIMAGLTPPQMPKPLPRQWLRRIPGGQIGVTAVGQNYPNPFNPETWLPYQLARRADVTIQIYDMSGQPVRHLALGKKEAGVYVTRDRAAYWDGKSDRAEKVASGIYFYALQTDHVTSNVKKMLLVK